MKIELGARTGAFRDRFLPGAVTTDKRMGEGIDLLVDATQLPFKPESVDEFVVNNPYRYGFQSVEAGVQFLKGIRTVLKPGGHLVIRASSRNPYANRRRIEQAASQLGLNVKVRKIDIQTEFPGHIFLTTRGDPTVPNFEFVISKGEESE
jgi:predicted SAM-dependent methyltransferase